MLPVVQTNDVNDIYWGKRFLSIGDSEFELSLAVQTSEETCVYGLFSEWSYVSFYSTVWSRNMEGELLPPT